ncbi:MAG: hypothetical protein HY079_01660 [Elusimicrobia bacterium]|nr:hypothetical protein [Elusimicrobiota bacterium]
MARLKTVYRCQQCGNSASKPMGQCPGCAEWNTMVEEVIETRPEGLVEAVAASAGRGALKWLDPHGEERSKAARLEP